MPIYEKNNEIIGRIIDILFNDGSNYSFIVGGSVLEEFLEKIRIIPDKNLIVPRSSVNEISDKIKINDNKNELITTLFESVKHPSNYLESTKSEFVPKKPKSVYENHFVDTELKLKYRHDKDYRIF